MGLTRTDNYLVSSYQTKDNVYERYIYKITRSHVLLNDTTYLGSSKQTSLRDLSMGYLQYSESAIEARQPVAKMRRMQPFRCQNTNITETKSYKSMPALTLTVAAKYLT